MGKLFKIFTFGIAMAFFISGCASTTQFVPFPDQAKRLDDSNNARIYVVRPTSFGSAVGMKVSDAEKPIGETGPNGYLCWERQPGDAEVVSKAENTSRLTLKTEKGTVYYIQQHVQLGILFARNKLTLLSEAEGKEKLKNCKPPKVKQPE